MRPRCARGFGQVVVLLILGIGLLQPPAAAGDRAQDEQRMKERLTALSRGQGSLADFRIQMMDGGMAAARHWEIAKGKVVYRAWLEAGASEQHSERAVTDDEIRALLSTLVKQEYWTFAGTRFVPDANMFLFRFYDKDLEPVDYSCDAEEYPPSSPRAAIRAIFLTFVSNGESLKGSMQAAK